MFKSIICAKNAIHAAEEKVIAKLRSKDGMELLQTVILIGIALALGGVMMWFLSEYFGDGDEGFWGSFKTKLNAILDQGDVK